MSKSKIASIFSKWWFNASLFGLVSVCLFIFTGNKLLTGMSIGMGLMYFVQLFSDKSNEE